METPSLLPPPKREHIPTLLLLLPEYFETLFKLMHTLSTIPGKTGVSFSEKVLYILKISIYKAKKYF